MTKYSDFVSVREQKAAYNIEHEQGTDWKNFISNDIFNDILGTVITSVRNNDVNMHKSFWIEGTYGTGKSHAGAVIKHLLCDTVEDIKDYVDAEFSGLQGKFLREQLYKLRAQKRLLPVNLYGQSNITHRLDLALEIQRAVKQGLKDSGIDLPAVKTDYEIYLNHINQNRELWELLLFQSAKMRSYYPTIDKLIQEIKSEDLGAINKIEEALRESEIDIRLKTSDLAQWFFETQNMLAKETEYDGFFVIWDEFTEVMKSDMGMSLLIDLQKIDELVMNSENNSYFLYISHPSAFNVLSPEDRTKTRGRYHCFKYNMVSISAFHIMSSKIRRKEENIEEFLDRVNSFYTDNSWLYERYSEESDNKLETIGDLKKLYPLHPSTLNLAAYYAREAGSNNRSVFQFLGENPKIQEFLDDESKYGNNDLITADYLWDYVYDEFTENVARYGAVTERFNSYKSHIDSKGENYLKVFKGILLLNALNNLAQHATVVPSAENIHNLFVGTTINPDVDEILNYFDNNSIVNRLPGDLFSIQFSALPRTEIEAIKEKLMNDSSKFKYTASLLHYGDDARKQLETLITGISRAHSFGTFGVETNEYTSKMRILNDYESKPKWELYLAMLFARNNQELNQLKEWVKEWVKDEAFKNIVLIVFEVCLTDKSYERFIEYQANAQCAQAHGYDDQQNAHSKNSKELISLWINSIRKGNFTYYIGDVVDTYASGKICTTMNACVSPLVFSSGPESLVQIQNKGSKTGWKQALAKQMAVNVLSYNTKTEIINKCNAGTDALFMILLQDSVDENLNWKDDINPDHPLYKVYLFIDNKFKHIDKSKSFNIGEKLEDLTRPPYGLYPSSFGIGMVSFAMRNWINQIYDMNGSPRTSSHLVDDVTLMFRAWETKKPNPRLEFRFEPKESRSLSKIFVKIFKLDKLPGFSSELASLTQTRWAILHNFSTQNGYPLWALKYVDNKDDKSTKIIDNILKICNSTGRDISLFAETLNLYQDYEFEFKNLLNLENNYEIGFNNYLKGNKEVQVGDKDLDSVIDYLKKHMQNEVGLWSEDEVNHQLLVWQIEHLKQVNNNVNTPPSTTPITPIQTPSIPSNTIKESDSSYGGVSKAVSRISKMNDVQSMRTLLKKICELNISEVINLINKG